MIEIQRTRMSLAVVFAVLLTVPFVHQEVEAQPAWPDAGPCCQPQPVW